MLKKRMFFIAMIAILVSATLVICLHPHTVYQQISDSITIGTVEAAVPTDYTCDGVDDDIQFQLALQALPTTGGRITFMASSLSYNFSDQVSRNIDNVIIEGVGFGSSVEYAGGAAFSAGIQANWVFRDFQGDINDIDVSTATRYQLVNIKLGTNYIGYEASSDWDSSEFVYPAGFTTPHELYYNASSVDTSDLETSTKTVSATSEASGTVNADYSSTKTVCGSPPTEVTVLQLAQRLSVTIAAGMTCTAVNCRAYLDTQDANHRLFDMQWTTVGAKTTSSLLTVAVNATLYGLLLDGGSHTVYFFFWVDSNNCGLTLVQWQAGVGSNVTVSTDPNAAAITLDVTGRLYGSVTCLNKGGGTWVWYLLANSSFTPATASYFLTSSSSTSYVPLQVVNNPTLSITGITTDVIKLITLIAFSYVESDVRTVSYAPGYTTTGDLESGTKTVSATAEASGVGNADYSYSMTSCSSPTPGVSVLKLASQLDMVVDTLVGTQLRCRLYLDTQDANHMLVDGTWTSTGTKHASGEFTLAINPTIFNLLLDHGVHTLYFFLWMDSSTATVTWVQGLVGIGSAATTNSAAANALEVTTDSGFMSGFFSGATGLGSSISLYIRPLSISTTSYVYGPGTGLVSLLAVNTPVFAPMGSAAGCITVITDIELAVTE